MAHRLGALSVLGQVSRGSPKKTREKVHIVVGDISEHVVQGKRNDPALCARSAVVYGDPLVKERPQHPGFLDGPVHKRFRSLARAARVQRQQQWVARSGGVHVLAFHSSSATSSIGSLPCFLTKLSHAAL